MDDALPYVIEMSHDAVSWTALPRGYRQAGTVVDRIDGALVQYVGRGTYVFYRARVAVSADAGPAPATPPNGVA